jgi:hypothetical protein
MDMHAHLSLSPSHPHARPRCKAAFPGSAEHKSGAEAGGEGNPLQRLAERGAALRQQFGREFERVAAKRRARAEQLREAEAKERMGERD